MKLALVGAGARGMIYSRYAHDVLGNEIVAVADRHPEKLEKARSLFGTPENMLFTDPLEMIGKVPEADALIVATTDRDHYAHAMAGLERGWHLLLEKPISPEPLECLKSSDDNGYAVDFHKDLGSLAAHALALACGRYDHVDLVNALYFSASVSVRKCHIQSLHLRK